MFPQISISRLNSISVAVVGNHKFVRTGLKGIISQFERIEQVYETQYGKAFMELMDNVKVDVVLLDVRLSISEGEKSCMILSTRYPSVQILVLSMFDDCERVMRMLHLGARGYLGKNAGADEVKNAIHDVIDKGFYFNDVVENAFRNNGHGSKSPFGLTVRELEIINLICAQFTMPEIGKRLHISEKTVQNHRTKIMKKLGARNTAGVVMMALGNNLIRTNGMGEFF